MCIYYVFNDLDNLGFARLVTHIQDYADVLSLLLERESNLMLWETTECFYEGIVVQP